MEGLMLIVDDVEVNREILKVLFQTQYDILTAENGEQALAMLEGCQGNIDVVLLDLQMPGASGMELLKQRKELDYFKDVPVVVITSSINMEDQIEAFNLGANDFIQKPFIPEIVLSRVSNVMASARRLMSIELEAEKLKMKSETDEMTGLLNKTTTELMIHERLKRSDNQLDAMLIIDIDNFKMVNDTSGHQAGDHVIKIIANLISSRFRKTDFVGRIGGDEFCVLMSNVSSVKTVYEKVNELVQVMRYKPNLSIPEYVTISVGLATNHRHATTYAELFRKADEALYKAKTNGRAQYQEYGVEQLSVVDDKRPVVLLLSHNRSVCSSIHAMLPLDVRIIELVKLEDIDIIKEQEQKRIEFVFVDVSSMLEDTSEYWERVKSVKWIRMDRVFAICQEGMVSQYVQALSQGVLDMFMEPLESKTFKRRTGRYFVQAGLMEDSEE